MRAGKIGFRAFLYERRVPGYDNPNCECGEKMTVTHVLLKCVIWDGKRAAALVDQDRRTIQRLLSTRKGCLAAIRLVQQTELLEQFKAADLGREVEGDEEEDRTRRRTG